jgi:hypothetical protein
MASARSAVMTSLFVNGATRERRGTFEIEEKDLGLQKEVIMKVFTILAGFIFFILLVSSTSSLTSDVTAQDGKKPQDTYTMATETKLGTVTFNHLDHITKKRSADGTCLITCVECHHTAQPAAEALKHPPHKTVWPADRTTTLTMELIEKDPNALGAVCRDCHARADTKPKLLPEIPQVKFEDSAEPTVMTNQQAFHRRCGACHDEAVKARPNLDPPPPTSKKCLDCHKRTTA